MNSNDIKRLENLNERYTPVNMTAFRIVDGDVSKKTVLKHIAMDLEILNTSDVENKHVYRIIISKDCIDICSNDNGTPVSYFFCEDATFTPQSIGDEVKELCTETEVFIKDW